jgi:phytoene dehydrogenase-like protein
MTSTAHAPIVIVGGGLSGLVAANHIARRGLPVAVLEKTSAVGGRAMTRERHGFLFNLGPHALYRAGTLQRTLRDFGIAVHGGVPTGAGGYALYRGRRHTLPTGLASLMTTGLLNIAEKIELARFQTALPAIDAAAADRETLSSWLDARVHHERVRDLLRTIVRVTTFTNDPGRQSAGAALAQLQLGLKGVLYLDGGWQTIVEGLRRTVIAAGARIVTAAAAIGLDTPDRREVTAVRLPDGTAMRASAVVIAAGPDEVDAISGQTTLASTLPAPVRIATLDVALRSLPRPKQTVAFGVDTPLYFSVHSALARLAPQAGALIHVSKYLRPDENAGREVEQELERLMDDMQPGWRDRVEARHYLPSLTVTHSEVTAASGGLGGRPTPRLAAFDNVFIAGDWVGPHGQLSDAAAASAADAARLAIEAAGNAARLIGATIQTA